jgi:hypothetical protein
MAGSGLGSYFQASVSVAVIFVFVWFWYDLIKQYPGWIVVTPFLAGCVGCIGIGAIHHAFSYSRTALTALRTANVVLLIFAMVFSYGPGAWVWPAAIIALLLTSIASGRQRADIRRLTNNSV